MYHLKKILYIILTKFISIISKDKKFIDRYYNEVWKYAIFTKSNPIKENTKENRLNKTIKKMEELNYGPENLIKQMAESSLHQTLMKDLEKNPKKLELFKKITLSQIKIMDK